MISKLFEPLPIWGTVTTMPPHQSITSIFQFDWIFHQHFRLYPSMYEYTLSCSIADMSELRVQIKDSITSAVGWLIEGWLGTRVTCQQVITPLVLSHDQGTCRKGVCGKVQFLHGCLDVSYTSWDRSKNSCLCGNCTFLKEVPHQNLESTQSAASCFPRPNVHWKDMGSCLFSWEYESGFLQEAPSFIAESYLSVWFLETTSWPIWDPGGELVVIIYEFYMISVSVNDTDQFHMISVINTCWA